MAQKNLNDLRGPATVTMKRRRTKVIRKLATPFARDAIEGLADGLDIFGFTKGQFSFVDLIDTRISLGPWAPRAGPSRPRTLEVARTWTG